jgi:pyruvate,water dikinase
MENPKVLVKGIGASPGRATGIAKIVSDVNEANQKITKGDILVTDMTNPDFVMFMEKSSAIITNTGGVLCHAAIVSRELGIPCVTGTRYATKVLKDGMKVLVDGLKGIVYEVK